MHNRRRVGKIVRRGAEALPLPRLRGRVREGAVAATHCRGVGPLPYPPPQAGEGIENDAVVCRRPGGAPWLGSAAKRPYAVTSSALALILAVSASNPASTQQPPPRIWDVQLPSPVGDLPDEEFVDPACGTNGGPPGLAIGTFERFERCRPEASGLREIWFRYDDEWEFIARAARDPDAIARNNAMIVLGQPVTLSLLIDRAGLVQGYRIFTDPRAEEEVRSGAYAVAVAFKARFGAQGWTCNDTPPAEGETPILGIFVKERCEKVEDGQALTVESRHYYKPGQATLDPNTGLPTINQFESSARLQVTRVDALGK
jgi:hypothetical protein